MSKVSVVIPSRNEPYLARTIQDILEKAKGDIEVIAVLDGYWESPEKINFDARVSYLHFPVARGMRNAINSGVAVARGEYILKCDAHCMFDWGFDEILKKNLEDNWIAVPRRYPLDPVNWRIEERGDDKYPIDYMYLDNNLHGVEWRERNTDPSLKDKKIDDLMSAQGSCWFMKKKYFEELELLDEATYGTFWSEFQEIGLKCWLSGGRIIVNKETWYAHYHKVGSRGYSLADTNKDQTQKMVEKWLSLKEKAWHKQIHDINWLIRKFSPIPTW